MEKLDSLLEKFYNVQLSVPEERELEELLSDPALPSEYFADRDAVLGLSGCGSDRTPEIPEGFGRRLEEAIESASRRSRFRLYTVRFMAAAAVLIAGIVIAAVFSDGDDARQEDLMAEMSVEDAREATKKAFDMLSYGLGKGHESVVIAEDRLGKAGRTVNEMLEKLNNNL